MTLNDIARMFTYAKVPRSKTVEHLFPNPITMVEVPAEYVLTVRSVVAGMARPGQRFEVSALSPHAGDVGPSEHVYFKIKNAIDSPHVRGISKGTRIIQNKSVVIEFAHVAS
jgi:hypothetical protein